MPPSTGSAISRPRAAASKNMAELDQRACTRRLAHLALLLRRASVPRSPTHALCDDELAARRELALCLAPVLRPSGAGRRSAPAPISSMARRDHGGNMQDQRRLIACIFELCL